MNLPKSAATPDLLNDLANWACSESAVLTEDGSPFHGSHMPGDPRVLVITGENASGKSLVFRLLAAIAKSQHDTLAITISIRERTGAGLGEMNHMRRVFMFGDEEKQSTGAASVKVVEAGFRNVDRDVPTILGLDEPEMGLSDGYAEALGEFIGQKSGQLPANCRGVVVVTHNRRLVKGLIAGLGATPSYVSMTEIPQSIDQWLASTDRKSLDELMALGENSLNRFRAIQKILDRK